MNFSLPIIALTGLGLGLGLVLAGCDGQSSGKSQSISGSTSAAGHAFMAYAEKGIDYSWPHITGNETPVTSDALLAKNYYVVLDGSGSMDDSKCANSSRKMEVAKEAIAQFLTQIPSDANVGFYAFDSNGSKERMPLGQHTSSATLQAVKSVYAGGGTPLSSSVAQGVKALTKQAERQLGYGEYNLIVVTDGMASTGYDPRNVVNAMVGSTAITMHTIGFCIDSNHPLNKVGYSYYKSANNPEALKAGLDEVLAEADDFDVSVFEGKG